MDRYQRVVWTEGMLLGPHHFQQADRHLEHQLRRRCRGLEWNDWGVCGLELDKDGLAEGKLVVREATGVLPDGTWFEVPSFDAAPAPRALDAVFPAGAERLGVFLALPDTASGAAVRLADAASPAPTRFEAATARVRDDADATRERELQIARKRLRVVFEGEPQDGLVTLEVAQLQRAANGQVEVNKAFIPPCLYVSASEGLVSLLRKLLDVLAKKSDDLAQQRRQRGRGLAEFNTSEAASFWFLHTINGHIPGLSSAFQQPRAHPITLYRELAALAGELFSFSPDGHPRDVPPYRHDDLSGTFGALANLLRKLLGTVLPTRTLPVPLERQSEAFFAATIHDDRFLSARLFLSVKAAVPEEKLVNELPLKAKVSSKDRVQGLVVKAVAGLPLRHVPAPPADIPLAAGRQCFQLGQAGDHWEAIKASRTVGLYIPVEFTGLEVELVAVTE